MQLKAHFSNIHTVIIAHVEQAQSEIVAAIAWFTDRDIFEVLCTKARSGVKVSVALIGDEINRGPGGLHFDRLSALGGNVAFLPSGNREPTMHHKFCVIDRDTVITGSYNWSHKARTNDENITVVTGSADFAGKYLDSFDRLLARGGHANAFVVDADAARRRLEMIRNLILLREQEDIPAHLRKLRPVAEALNLGRIVDALGREEYTAALELIDEYMRRATALVVAGASEIPRLRLQLQTLELRLESLSEEMGDLERSLITFNRAHNDDLGELIQQVLRARAELARRQLKEQTKGQQWEDAEAAAKDAQQAYEEFSRQHEELQRAQPLPKLDEEAEREIRLLYRKACGLCHPDKVTEDLKDAAHRAFVELQEAYKGNDLKRVRAIYESLAAGGMPGTRSTTLSEVEVLKAAIAELENAIGALVAELKSLKKSEGVRLMEGAGAVEADWKVFFERQREVLEKELARIEALLASEQDGVNP